MSLTSSSRKLALVLWAAFWVMQRLPGTRADLHAADVHILLKELWAEPADIVVNEGDRVVWDLGIDAAHLWDLEGRFDFRSTTGAEGTPSFAFVYSGPGIYGYQHQWISSEPPYRTNWANYVSRGTVEVLPCRSEAGELMLNAPISGACFPAVYHLDGRPTAVVAAIPMLASARCTNGLMRIEYALGDEPGATRTNWTQSAHAFTSRIGRVAVTATAFYCDGRTITSAKRFVEVVPSVRPFADGGVISSPRHVRDNLYLVEYRTGGGGGWHLALGSDLGSNAPATGSYQVSFLKAENGGWGRFPLIVDGPREFLWYYVSY